MIEDRSFDGVAERFARRIYGSPKGELRLQLIWRDMQETIPPLASAPLKVWDAGGGLGQIGERLAEMGHNVLLSDLSADMLALAERRLQDRELPIRIVHQSIQQHAAVEENRERYDLIVCHAVLEWLADPRAVLEQLLGCLRPGGHLSLMFYNVNTMVMSNIIKGNFYKLFNEDFAGHPGGLTPPGPLQPLEVLGWLQELGIDVLHKRSVRFAYDLMPKPLREQRSLDDVMRLEWQYGDREPFWQLGRYVHLVSRKPRTPNP